MSELEAGHEDRIVEANAEHQADVQRLEINKLILQSMNEECQYLHENLEVTQRESQYNTHQLMEACLAEQHVANNECQYLLEELCVMRQQALIMTEEHEMQMQGAAEQEQLANQECHFLSEQLRHAECEPQVESAEFHAELDSRQQRPIPDDTVLELQTMGDECRYLRKQVSTVLYREERACTEHRRAILGNPSTIDAVLQHCAFAKWKYRACSLARVIKCVCVLSDSTQSAFRKLLLCFLEWSHHTTLTRFSHVMASNCDLISEELVQSQQDQLMLLQKFHCEEEESSSLDSLAKERFELEAQQTAEELKASSVEHRQLQEKVVEMQIGCQELKQGCQMASEVIHAEVEELALRTQQQEECEVRLALVQEEHQHMQFEKQAHHREMQGKMRKLREELKAETVAQAIAVPTQPEELRSEMQEQLVERQLEIQNLQEQHDREVRQLKGRARTEIDKQKSARAADQKSFTEQRAADQKSFSEQLQQLKSKNKSKDVRSAQEGNLQLRKAEKEFRERSKITEAQVVELKGQNEKLQQEQSAFHERSKSTEVQITELRAQNARLLQRESREITRNLHCQEQVKKLLHAEELSCLAYAESESQKRSLSVEHREVLTEISVSMERLSCIENSSRVEHGEVLEELRNTQGELENAFGEATHLENKVQQLHAENCEVLTGIEGNAQHELKRLSALHAKFQTLTSRAELGKFELTPSTAECQAINGQLEVQSMMLRAEVNLLRMEVQDAASDACCGISHG
eukprot:gnl/MRDRNA2_/MRDRNA2_60732_c0_seq1.p1 gnl/MRDRNA2_/MRDRNA2_60732_c0~~gnl/MRDRNA2_/MRDRNA2_60732_c0_seq1.p1  ORF type:complete len:751 (+),score=182.50 gnl/MRDRNA2_/MRDRNA2_60732_c0_seq1:1371-3623(+)